jgi:hypothetical protein
MSLWGLLAAVSALFPLSNKLLSTIPLAKREGTGVGLVMIDPNLPTTLATFVSLFLLFLCVSSRQGIASLPAAYVRILSGVVFALGLVLFVSYMYLYTIYDGTYRSIMREISLTVLYAGFFSCSTMAFTLLGLKEYMSAER